MLFLEFCCACTSYWCNLAHTLPLVKIKFNALSFQLKSALAKSKSFSHQKKQFSPVVFYGSPRGVPPKKPTGLWRLLHEIRLDLSQRNKLSLRCLSDAGSTLYCVHLFVLLVLHVSEYDFESCFIFV